MDKPIWKMKEFWLPVITGLATAISFAIEVGTGILLEPAILVSIGLFLLGAFLGVDWAMAKKCTDELNKK